MTKHGFPDDCGCPSEDICQFIQRREATLPESPSEFEHWLNARRDLPVSEVFHDIVARFAALTPSPAPSAAPHKGTDALREALAGDVCPLCGGKGLHKHSPEEIVIFRNGAKFARRQQNKAEFDEIMSASEQELDAMLRAEGIDPDEATESGRRAARAALAPHSRNTKHRSRESSSE